MPVNRWFHRHQRGLLVAGLCALAGMQVFGKRSDLGSEQTLDLASRINPKHSRQLKLGKAVPSSKGQEKEVEVILKDPAMSQKWGLQLTQAQKAWRLSRGSKKIVVAVIDTGIDLQHEDLQDNLWVNKGEIGRDQNGRNKSTNGIDDDGNGYVDDVHGWNFASNNNDLSDNHGHGTHIAGIIGARGGNGKGISGVAPKVSVMTLKYYDPEAKGVNNLMNTVKAIRYATKMGAQIINYSGGGLEPSPPEKRAISLAAKKGTLVVAAAGNEKSNSDVHGYYPADYDLPNIVSVTAVNKQKKVLPTSNYGEKTVDLAAPGNNIYSTLPNNQYGYMTGTSQATAFVSGVASLVMAQNPQLKVAQNMIKYLTQTGDIDPRLAGKTRYRKRLNSYKALAIKDLDENLTGSRVTNLANIDQDQFTAVSRSQSAQRTSRSNAAQFALQSKQILKFLPKSIALGKAEQVD